MCNRRGRRLNPGRPLATSSGRRGAANYYRALQTTTRWRRHSPRSGRRWAAHNHLSRRRTSSASWSWRTRRSSAHLKQRYGSVQHLVAKHPADGCLRLQHRLLGLQTPENGQPPPRYFVFAVVPHPGVANPRPGCERQPNIEVAPWRNPRESLLDNSNDRESRSVQLNRAPNHVSRPAEGALPVTIVEHRHRRRRRRIVAQF